MTSSGEIRPETPIDKLAWAIIAIACGLSIVTTGILLAAMPFNRHFATTRDFVIYWATGQQLAHHGNPFDPNLMGQTERAGGFDRNGSFYMRNPPWSLPLTLPLGYVSAQAAALPWSLLLLGILVFCVLMLRRMVGRPGTHLEWIGYCFPPAMQVLIMGQTALFLLLGLVLFLRLHRTRPFWAGAALWFCTLKPHLFLPFCVALLAWIVVSRSWRIVAGAALAMAASCAVTEWIDPAAWSQYAHWAHTSGISQEANPCLAVALRNLLDPGARQLVFLPAALGCVWALAYFWPRRKSWDWMENGGLVMLVSLVVAPYCWVADHSLALPALLFAAWRTRSAAVLAALGAICLALELQPLFLSKGMNTAWYVWVAPAWLGWYLLARRSTRLVAPSTQPELAQALG
jgi:hypothetical protein